MVNDSTVRSVVGACCITAAYCVYVTWTHAQTQAAPDGLVFASAVGAIAALCGYSIGASRPACCTPPESAPESLFPPSDEVR